MFALGGETPGRFPIPVTSISFGVCLRSCAVLCRPRRVAVLPTRKPAMARRQRPREGSQVRHFRQFASFSLGYYSAI